MTFYENILTVFILMGIFVLGYLRMSNKTFGDMVEEIKGMFQGKPEDLDLKW